MSIELGTRLAPVGAVRGLEGLGVKLTAPLGISVPEGPAPRSFLENTMTHTIASQTLAKPLVVIYEPKPSLGFEAQNAISEAELILAQARTKPSLIEPGSTEPEIPKIFQDVFAGIQLDPTIKAEEVSAELLTPPRLNYRERIKEKVALMLFLGHTLLPFLTENKLIPTIEQVLNPKTQIENKLDVHHVAQPYHAPDIAHAVSSKTHSPPVKSGVAHHATEAVIHIPHEEEGEEGEGELGFQEHERIERMIEPGLIEDEGALLVREVDLSKAIETQPEGRIEGKSVVINLGDDSTQRRGESVNKEDPHNILEDGSWEKVKEEVGVRTFDSKEQAKVISFALNKKFRPEKKGKIRNITQEEHARIHKNHGHPLQHPFSIFEQRISKKGVVFVEAVEEQKQGRLEDNPELEAVFS